jgi:thiol-disulfide isomerase/thioredoxin
MPALEQGTNAPRFALRLVDAAAERGPVFDRWTLLAFYKTTCPTCQLALPYLDAFKAYGEAGMDTLAVVEDPPPAAEEFRRNFGGTLETVTEPPPYAVSSSYGLTNVPTLFLVEPGGRIAGTVVGFSKRAYNDLSAAAAAGLGVAPVEICPADDGAPDFKPG